MNLRLLAFWVIGLFATIAIAQKPVETAERLIGDNRESAREVSALPARASENAREKVPTLRSRDKKAFAQMSPQVFETLKLNHSEQPQVALAPVNTDGAMKARCVIIGSDAWVDGEDNSGVYEFPLSGSYSFSLVGKQYDMYKMATYNEGTIYTVYYDYKTKFSSIRHFDEATLEMKKEVPLKTIIDADAIAYDPATGNIYAYYYVFGRTTYCLGIINAETGDVSEIKDYGNYDYKSGPLWRALISTPDGSLYCMDSDGNLGKVNKQNGDLTIIGNTGCPTKYLTSGLYDAQSGKIYYATCTAGSALYTIDPATAKSTKIYDIPYSEQIVGMYVPAAPGDPKTPGAPRNISAQFPNGSLEGVLTFTAPTTYLDGSAATGDFTAVVSVDGEEKATKTFAYGAGTVSVPVAVGSRGVHTFKLVLKNDKGQSAAVVTSLYVGADDPSAVTDVVAKWDDGKTTITWKPTEAAHGGFLDPEKTVYKITRYVGTQGTVLTSDCKETTFVDEYAEPEGKIERIYYAVQAVCGDLKASPSLSSYITIGIIVPPFSDFVSDNVSGAFKVIDANKDGVTWYYSKNALRYDYARKVDANDYLLLPKVKLTAGQIYTLSFDASCSDSNYPERVAAYVGNDAVLSALTTELVKPTDITSTSPVTLEGNFVCKETGIYYFAIKACSDMNKDELIITGIRISAGSSAKLPNEATNITAKADPNGKQIVTLGYTAPSVNLLGEKLESLDKVEIYCGDQLIQTQNPAPGAEMTYVHNEAGKGMQSYSIVAYNGEGVGKKASVEVFVGYDVPSAVANLKVVKGANAGEVILTWDPVTTDVRGAVLPAGSVTYAIASNIGNKSDVVKTGLAENTYKFQACAADAEQQFAQFGVFAVSAEGAGAPVASSAITVGKPYALPWNESFANAKPSSIFATMLYRGEPHWEIYDDSYLPDVKSQDGDNGYANHYATGAYDCGALVTGSIDLTQAKHPALSFYFYPILASSGDDTNTIHVVVSDGTGFVAINEPFVLCEKGKAGEWNKATISLEAYKGKIVQVGICPTTYKYGNTFLDNISVYDRLDNDLAVSMVAPESIMGGETGKVLVSVENVGYQTTGEYTVDLKVDGEVINTAKCPALAETLVYSVEFDVPTTLFTNPEITLTALVNYSADQNADNNSSVVKVAVKVPEHPVPTSLTAEPEGDNVKLSWTAPDLTMSPTESIVDTFESYDSFARYKAGDWKFIDLDGAGVGGWKNINIPGMPALTKDASFFIFDNTDSQFNKSYNAHSGNKFLAVIYNYNLEDNNDWAISPQLSGTEQTISLFARSYNKSYKENFTIMYSTTTDNPDDFLEVGSVKKIPNEWGEYTFDLPAGSKYFAIRYKTEANEMLMIDDVTYSPAGAAPIYVIAGYNVYRDGVKVNEAPVTTPSYVDATAPAGNHVYNVTALYTTKGESAPSNSVSMTTSGVEDLGVNAADAVYYTPQGILVSNPEAGQLYIVVRNGVATKEIYRK